MNSFTFEQLRPLLEQKTQVLQHKKQKRTSELQITISEERIAAEGKGAERTKSPRGRNPPEYYHRLHCSNRSLELKHIENGKGERIEDHITTRTCQRKVTVTAKASKAFLRESTRECTRDVQWTREPAQRRRLCRRTADDSPPQTQPIVSPAIVTSKRPPLFLWFFVCRALYGRQTDLWSRKDVSAFITCRVSSRTTMVLITMMMI